jgi:hypothetical protein
VPTATCLSRAAIAGSGREPRSSPHDVPFRWKSDLARVDRPARVIGVRVRAARVPTKDAQAKNIISNENDGGCTHRDKEQAAEPYRDLLKPAAVQPFGDRRTDAAAKVGNRLDKWNLGLNNPRGLPVTRIISRRPSHLFLPIGPFGSRYTPHSRPAPAQRPNRQDAGHGGRRGRQHYRRRLRRARGPATPAGARKRRRQASGRRHGCGRGRDRGRGRARRYRRPSRRLERSDVAHCNPVTVAV